MKSKAIDGKIFTNHIFNKKPKLKLCNYLPSSKKNIPSKWAQDLDRHFYK